MRDLLKSVGRHAIIYGIGDLLGKSIGFLLIPVYTAYLLPEEYGTLDLLDLTGYLVGLFVAMGMTAAVFRYYHAYDDDERRDEVVSSAWLASVVVPVAVFGVLWWRSDWISTLVFGSADQGRLFRILFVTLVFNLANDVPMAWLRARERSITFTIVNLVRLVCALSLNLLFLVRFDMGVRGILLSGLITACTISGITGTIFFRSVTFRPTWTMARRLLAFGIPLIGGWLGSFLLNYSDRFFLKHYTSLTDIGIYSLSYKLGMIPTMAVTMPFMMAWAPRQFRVEKEEPDAPGVFGKIFTYFIGLHVLLVAGAAVCSREVISIMANPEYARSALFIAPLMAAYAFQGVQQFGQFGLMLRQQTKRIGICVLFAAVVNIGLNALFVPRYGVTGATWTTVAAFGVLISVIVPLSQRSFRIRYERWRIAKLIAVAAVVAWVAAQIELTSEMLSLVYKSSVLLVAVPVCLWMVKFFLPSEIAAVRSLLGRSA